MLYAFVTPACFPFLWTHWSRGGPWGTASQAWGDSLSFQLAERVDVRLNRPLSPAFGGRLSRRGEIPTAGAPKSGHAVWHASHGHIIPLYPAPGTASQLALVIRPVPRCHHGLVCPPLWPWWRGHLCRPASWFCILLSLVCFSSLVWESAPTQFTSEAFVPFHELPFYFLSGIF